MHDAFERIGFIISEHLKSEKHICTLSALGFPGFESYFDLSLHKYSQQNFTLEISQFLFVYV